MKRPLKRLVSAAGRRQPASTFQPAKAAALLFSLLLCVVAHGQNGWKEPSSVHSLSGQFVVGAAPEFSPQLHRADLATNNEYVRLEPALLAVTAERFKTELWQELGLKAGGAWSGKIYLTLRPARSLDDQVNIRIGPLLKAWNYHVELPDLVLQMRFARALTGTLLLEIANRANGDANHSAEIPPWLTDGLAGQVLGNVPAKIILSSPSKKSGDIVLSRLNNNERGFDPLLKARQTLRDYPALTFDQLSWPTGDQMDGRDGGAYLASAQVFVASLLELKDGEKKMRSLLAQLPGCLNWQVAFLAAFRDNFKRPLEVEKWWALRLVHFAAREPGPRWTPAISRERLDDLLMVPVEMRRDASSLPEHKVISLQAAVWQLAPAVRAEILRIKLRDFELAQFRFSQPFAGLAEGYRAALADFLGEGQNRMADPGREITIGPKHHPMDVAEILKKLNALDARRKAVEAKLEASPVPRRPTQNGH